MSLANAFDTDAVTVGQVGELLLADVLPAACEHLHEVA